ncbi:Serine/threonine-protein kinase pkn1 [Polystyrenella longa]|uniref:Serine/threonine-protein kinase pkn1 n=1 Tax=Polystyrenella longa TaxID=2528007 RepID=A0A518CSU6_9PLAN|nr:formylglycine-generating enzyme family protein [Polystyrenella longa]QDU82307.1 Serine/threonine-protein kinase pkn1 [Polystyrenella longa]
MRKYAITAISLAVVSCAVLSVWALVDSDAPPGDAPPGMVWIPGGEFTMGIEDRRFRDTTPLHKVKVDGFWIDKTEVTNAQFKEFVDATDYVTVAERKPTQEEFPGAPPENLFAGSVCFSPPAGQVPLDNHLQWWNYVAGTSWKQPEGEGSNLEGRENHPVVHVAYEDALAFAEWAGKQIPTEAEWEYAARGGLEQSKFGWGDEFQPDGEYMANTFQGIFPNENTSQDGFVATAPVGSFPENGYGLSDMAGNVWEWTSDWYRNDTYLERARHEDLSVNPKGPSQEESFDPMEPGVQKRVQKGGSFLCTDQYCTRYVPGGRGKGEPSTGTSHTGFRCIKKR